LSFGKVLEALLVVDLQDVEPRRRQAADVVVGTRAGADAPLSIFTVIEALGWPYVSMRAFEVPITACASTRSRTLSGERRSAASSSRYFRHLDLEVVGTNGGRGA
jgi:hypothetical protein